MRGNKVIRPVSLRSLYKPPHPTQEAGAGDSPRAFGLRAGDHPAQACWTSWERAARGMSTGWSGRYGAASDTNSWTLDPSDAAEEARGGLVGLWEESHSPRRHHLLHSHCPLLAQSSSAERGSREREQRKKKSHYKTIQTQMDQVYFSITNEIDTVSNFGLSFPKELGKNP